MKAHTDIVPRPPMVDEGLPQSLEANELLSNKRLTKKRYQDLINIKRDRSNADRRNITMFFFLGLTISLLLVSTAINWKSYDQAELVDLGKLDADFDETIEVPLSEQPPPPPPVEKQPLVITEVSDEEIVEEIEVNLDVEMTEDTQLEDLNIDFTAEEPAAEEEVAEEIFTVVEQWPTPPGGMQSFYNYVASELEYPASARRLGVEGMVFVRFVVEKDGSITDVVAVKGIGAGCDEEAIRVVQNAPAWNPGKQRGRAVRVLMTVPIRFILKKR